MDRAAIGLLAAHEIERVDQLRRRRTLWERSRSGVYVFL
jgi:hypothetical protein